VAADRGPGERVRLGLCGVAGDEHQAPAGVLDREPDRVHLPGAVRVHQTGYIGSLLYILAHGIAKGGLFLCAGIIEHGTHTKDMTKMGGLFRKMPVTASAYVVCALSIAGIPPMAGFFCKWFVVSGLVEGGYTVIAASPS